MESTTDCFALLGEPRRPWIDPDTLKQRFHALSTGAHPDRFHGSGEVSRAAATAHFTALNRAYGCLRDPKSRVAHLLRLEQGTDPPDVQRIPPGTIELFTEVGAVGRAVDALLAERGAETSPMRRLQQFERGMADMERLDALLRRIGSWEDSLMAELRDLNIAWEAAPPPGHPGRLESLPLNRLGEIAQLLGYLARWRSQLEERRVRLGM